MSAIVAFLAYSLGYDSAICEVLAYLVFIDWVMGIATAIKHRRFNSLHLSRTLFKVFFYLLLLAAAHQSVRVHFIPNFFDDFVEAFITVTELKSIFENAALLGFKSARLIEAKLNSFLEDKLNRYD